MIINPCPLEQGITFNSTGRRCAWRGGWSMGISLKYCLVHGSGDGDDYDEEVFGLSIIRLASK